jgi:hypothetical protein
MKKHPMIAKAMSVCLFSLSVIAMASFTSCESTPKPEARISKPLMTDFNEVHWRMYYEDQFDAYGRAVPPGAGEPDVAWTAYYSEKNAYAIRENSELLKEQLRQEKKYHGHDHDHKKKD